MLNVEEVFIEEGCFFIAALRWIEFTLWVLMSRFSLIDWLETHILHWLAKLLFVIICLIGFGICVPSPFSFVIQSLQEGTGLINLLVVTISFFDSGGIICMSWYCYFHFSLLARLERLHSWQIALILELLWLRSRWVEVTTHWWKLLHVSS